eukprot:TRINITY_DN12655_c0_g1_i4.p1 TRINITY_DN12655_c0_g1~~TRINITY_DN12655_c0_g1_i4.p1  ORF type:complete len:225 (+),score=28.42 TRINITY_DN12655_c0_g1_i4:95-769(+)
MECDYTFCKYQCCINNECGSSYFRCNLATIIIAICLAVFIALVLLLVMCWKYSCCLFKNRSKASMRKETRLILDNTTTMPKFNFAESPGTPKKSGKLSPNDIFYSTDSMNGTATAFNFGGSQDEGVINVVDGKDLVKRGDKYLDNDSPEDKKDEEDNDGFMVPIVSNLNNEDRSLAANEDNAIEPEMEEENNNEINPFDDNTGAERKIVLKRGKNLMNYGVTPL